jgi:hypothetical protein
MKEFNYITKNVSYQEMKLLTADFYTKIGDIVYYKNKVFSPESTSQTELIHDGIEISHYACYYYKKALVSLVKGGNENIEDEHLDKETIMHILLEHSEFIYKKTSAKYCSVMARVLSDLGDVYFSARKEMCDDCYIKDDCKKLGDHVGFVKSRQSYSTSESFWTNWGELFIESNFKLTKSYLGRLTHNPLNNIELALFLYSLSIKFYKKANMYKQSALQITKIFNCFKFCIKPSIDIHREKILGFAEKHLKDITSRAIEYLYMANDVLDIFEILKRKDDIDKNAKVHLKYIQVDSEISKILVLQKELDLYLSFKDKELANPDILRNLYANYIVSPYCINYSVSARVHQLYLKTKLNLETYRIMKADIKSNSDDPYFNILSILLASNNDWKHSETYKIFNNDDKIKKSEMFNGEEKPFFVLLEMLIADTIFCFTEMLRLIKTSNDSYIFNHRFFAEIHRKLANRTNLYQAFNHFKFYICDNNANCNLDSKKAVKKAIEAHNLSSDKINDICIYLNKNMKIDNYLKRLLGADFREQMSSHYYNQKAFLHYQKSIETHSGGRAYFNLLEQMYFIKGDYDDVTSHFNVAEERFMINNTERYNKKLGDLKEINKKSSLYKSDYYFEKSE